MAVAQTDSLFDVNPEPRTRVWSIPEHRHRGVREGGRLCRSGGVYAADPPLGLCASVSSDVSTRNVRNIGSCGAARGL